MRPWEDSTTLIDALIEEQQNLPAVRRFSDWRETARGGSVAETHYRALLPLSAPGPGEQYAFEVDLDACSGCKACVTACHALNGLEDRESWRRVGLLVGRPDRPAPASSRTGQGTGERLSAVPRLEGLAGGGRPGPSPLLQHVTTACHHCVEPACLLGCPVLAYDKDPATGIVRHLDDQCIGCTYCVMMCPYEVPRYSERLGIVRKCDLCHDRLAQEQAPACVQACPNLAIRVAVVSQGEITRAFRASGANGFLPSSPAPHLTLPTTRFLTRRADLDRAEAADEDEVRPAPAHGELTGMLVLSQASVGLVLASAWTGSSPAGLWLASGLQAVALAMGTLHLGQPLRVWRAFLGWRTSWFSREVLAFGAYTGLLLWTALDAPGSAAHRSLLFATAAAGLAGVSCSALIYTATRRVFWGVMPVFARFLGATAALGGALALALQSVSGSASDTSLAALSLGAWAGALAAEWRGLRGRDGQEARSLRRTARLLRGPLRGIAQSRVVLALLGGLGLGIQAAIGEALAPLAWITVVGLLASVLLERHLFFTAVAPDRMPGGVPS